MKEKGGQPAQKSVDKPWLPKGRTGRRLTSEGQMDPADMVGFDGEPLGASTNGFVAATDNIAALDGDSADSAPAPAPASSSRRQLAGGSTNDYHLGSDAEEWRWRPNPIESFEVYLVDDFLKTHQWIGSVRGD